MNEIKIHQKLKHSTIVSIDHHFEDNDNVYIMMELCRNETLSDLVKRRGGLTELESKYFLRQIIDGLKYIHSENVIHRDLKLGNLFLTNDLRIKIGDFGLATMVAGMHERRRTICGTPNYMAPEVLAATKDHADGYCFPADIWAIGIIAYALLNGHPPFETPDVKETYRKISALNFKFPDSFSIEARDFIMSILQADPYMRPTLLQLESHPFLAKAPAALPLSCLFESVTETQLMKASGETVYHSAMSITPLGPLEVGTLEALVESRKNELIDQVIVT